MIVIVLEGGLVQYVFHNDPHEKYVVVDWDVDGANQDDPHMVVKDRKVFACVSGKPYRVDTIDEIGSDTHEALRLAAEQFACPELDPSFRPPAAPPVESPITLPAKVQPYDVGVYHDGEYVIRGVVDLEDADGNRIARVDGSDKNSLAVANIIANALNDRGELLEACRTLVRAWERGERLHHGDPQSFRDPIGKARKAIANAERS